MNRDAQQVPSPSSGGRPAGLLDRIFGEPRPLRTLDLPDSMTTPEKIANQISWLKNQLISWEDFTPRDGNELSGILEDAYPAYQRELLTANAVDFDDLMSRLARYKPTEKLALEGWQEACRIRGDADTARPAPAAGH